jgi:hypothetical protein
MAYPLWDGLDVELDPGYHWGVTDTVTPQPIIFIIK